MRSSFFVSSAEVPSKVTVERARSTESPSWARVRDGALLTRRSTDWMWAISTAGEYGLVR